MTNQKEQIPREAFDDLKACIALNNAYADEWVKFREKWGLPKWRGPHHIEKDREEPDEKMDSE